MLDALTRYYDQLLRDKPDEVAPFGWCSQRVAYVAELSAHGELLSIVPLADREAMTRTVPSQVKRAVNIAANFLCDNSTYLLGVDNRGKPDRTARCFAAASELHVRLLEGIDTPCARAIRLFFSTWQPRQALDFKAVIQAGEKLLSGGNIAFMVQSGGALLDPLDDAAIRDAWESAFAESDDSTKPMRCLVTGERAPIARLHPSIKGVYGAQSSGASLVSFNAPAFESYGHGGEQGRNAPVSERAAQAYTTALNYLLSDPRHHVRLGDTTVVYWSDGKDSENSWVFSYVMGMRTADEEEGSTDTSVFLDAAMKAIARGTYRDVEGIDPDATFYVMGLAPSAARLAVKFFLRSSFGQMLDNIGRHYRRSEMAHAPHERDHLTPYQLLREVENPKAKKPVVTPVLNAPLLRAILEDRPYPAALYTNALMRIRATQEDPNNHLRKVTRGRASIIRAYLIRNRGNGAYSEETLTMKLNEQRNETAYCLGRAFAILERIQEAANEKVTITNRYFNSASATPATVFPLLLRLSQSHLAKIERSSPRYASSLRRQLHEVLNEERVSSFPKRLSLDEQGDFMLGNIHQRNKWFEKTNGNESTSDDESAIDEAKE